MATIKWTKEHKDKWGWTQAKDCYVKDYSCFDKICFQPHDWNRDGRLICAVNGRNGCPNELEQYFVIGKHYSLQELQSKCDGYVLGITGSFQGFREGVTLLAHINHNLPIQEFDKGKYPKVFKVSRIEGLE